MIEQHGTHICKNCGEEIAWSVFIRIEYAEQEKTMTAIERRSILDVVDKIRQLFAGTQGRRERAILKIAKELEEVAK